MMNTREKTTGISPSPYEWGQLKNLNEWQRREQRPLLKLPSTVQQGTMPLIGHCGSKPHRSVYIPEARVMQWKTGQSNPIGHFKDAEDRDVYVVREDHAYSGDGINVARIIMEIEAGLAHMMPHYSSSIEMPLTTFMELPEDTPAIVKGEGFYEHLLDVRCGFYLFVYEGGKLVTYLEVGSDCMILAPQPLVSEPQFEEQPIAP